MTSPEPAVPPQATGARFAEARKRLGWTLRDAERASGVPNAHISQIETGAITQPGAAVVAKLARAYGLQPPVPLQAITAALATGALDDPFLSKRTKARLMLEATAPHLEAAERARADDLATQLEHAKTALAGDNEGIRLWMLDCGALVEQHRKRAAEAAASGRERCAQLAEPETLAKAIHRTWCDRQGCDEVCVADRDEAATFLKVASLLRRGGEGGGT